MPPLCSSFFTFPPTPALFFPRNQSFVLMKKSGFFAASLAAASASATALSASSPAPVFLWDSGNTPQDSHQEEGNAENSSATASLTEKFAPRFDGLRFIETLVTAHR